MKKALRAAPRRLAMNDSFTFLMKELEKVDDVILEPLSGTDWPRDMPVITGGGLVENVASIDVTYASSGGEDDNLFFEATNDIPVIQADLSKQVARTFSWAEYMSFSTLEREKMAQVGRDPETFLNKGIRLHCDKTIDQNVYEANAVRMREKAIELADRLLRSDDDDGKYTVKLIRADLLRRNGWFEEVLEDYGQVSFGEELLDQIIDFERELARRGFRG